MEDPGLGTFTLGQQGMDYSSMIIQTMTVGLTTGILSLFPRLITMVNSHPIPNLERIFSLLLIRMVVSPFTKEFQQLILLDRLDILMEIIPVTLGGPLALLR